MAQRQPSVGSVPDGWVLALDARARCGNPPRLDELEGLKGISPPSEPHVETDLLPETLQPVALARSGKPSSLDQASGQALPYGSNGGLEAAPVALWSQPQHQPAARAPVSSQPQRFMESIEVRRAEPMPPYPHPTTGAPRRPRPGKPPAQLKEPLDADLNPEYQVNVPVVGGNPPICFRGKGAAYTLPTPNLPKQKSLPLEAQDNPVFYSFRSSYSEKSPTLSSKRLWKTTPMLYAHALPPPSNAPQVPASTLQPLSSSEAKPPALRLMPCASNFSSQRSAISFQPSPPPCLRFSASPRPSARPSSLCSMPYALCSRVASTLQPTTGADHSRGISLNDFN